MSSAYEDMQDGRARYYAVERGVVTDVSDSQEGLHRIRARVPGIIDRSAWAFPIGKPASVPKVGDVVCVWFVGGDPEQPMWAPGWYPRGKAPTEVQDPNVAKKDAHLIHPIVETDRVKVWIDDRPNQQQLAIADKQVGEVFFQIDLQNGVITISASAAVKIAAVGIVDIEASEIVLNGRRVLASEKPI